MRLCTYRDLSRTAISHGDYLCTFPIVCPVQHYLVWRVFLKVLDHQVTRASAQKREPPQKLGEGTKLLTSSAQGPPSQLNHHVLSPRSVLMFSVLAQSCLWLKLSGRMLLVSIYRKWLFESGDCKIQNEVKRKLKYLAMVSSGIETHIRN